MRKKIIACVLCAALLFSMSASSLVSAAGEEGTASVTGEQLAETETEAAKAAGAETTSATAKAADTEENREEASLTQENADVSVNENSISSGSDAAVTEGTDEEDAGASDDGSLASGSNSDAVSSQTENGSAAAPGASGSISSSATKKIVPETTVSDSSGDVSVTASGRFSDLTVSEADSGKESAIESILDLDGSDTVRTFDLDLAELDGDADIILSVAGTDLPAATTVTVYHFLDSAEAIANSASAVMISVDGFDQNFNEELAAAKAYNASVEDGYVYVETMETTVGAGSDEDDLTVDAAENELYFSISDCSTFTVDFHYEDFTYSIEGESEILLSDLFDAIGYTIHSASDAVSVVFSDETLLSVTAQDGDWLLTSLEAFDATETLTVTFSDGVVLEIEVTDDSAKFTETGKNGPVEAGNWNTIYYYQIFGTKELYTEKGITAFYTHLDNAFNNAKVTLYLYGEDGAKWGEATTDPGVYSERALAMWSEDYWFYVRDWEGSSKILNFYMANASNDYSGYIDDEDLPNDYITVRFWNIINSQTGTVNIVAYDMNIYEDTDYCIVKEATTATSVDGETRLVNVYVNNKLEESASKFMPTRGSLSTMKTSDIEVTFYNQDRYTGYTVTVDSSTKTYNVYLTAKQYTVTASAGDSGVMAATPASKTYLYGEDASVTFSTNDGYYLDYIMDGDEKISITGDQTSFTYTIKSIDSDHEVVAYTRSNIYFDTGGGTINLSGTSIVYTGSATSTEGWSYDYKLSYSVADSVTLPTPIKDGFTFKGWMLTVGSAATATWDAAGTVYSGGQMLSSGRVGNILLVAQWEENVTTGNLTIQKTVSGTADLDQVFIFTITDSGGFSMIVTVKANDSVTIYDLPAGTYTVMEDTEWAWNYEPTDENKSVDVQSGETSSVSFENTKKSNPWLTAMKSIKNIFGSGN